MAGWCRGAAHSLTQRGKHRGGTILPQGKRERLLGGGGKIAREACGGRRRVSCRCAGSRGEVKAPRHEQTTVGAPPLRRAGGSKLQVKKVVLKDILYSGGNSRKQKQGTSGERQQWWWWWGQRVVGGGTAPPLFFFLEKKFGLASPASLPLPWPASTQGGHTLAVPWTGKGGSRTKGRDRRGVVWCGGLKKRRKDVRLWDSFFFSGDAGDSKQRPIGRRGRQLARAAAAAVAAAGGVRERRAVRAAAPVVRAQPARQRQAGRQAGQAGVQVAVRLDGGARRDEGAERAGADAAARRPQRRQRVAAARRRPQRGQGRPAQAGIQAAPVLSTQGDVQRGRARGRRWRPGRQPTARPAPPPRWRRRRRAAVRRRPGRSGSQRPRKTRARCRATPCASGGAACAARPPRAQSCSGPQSGTTRFSSWMDEKGRGIKGEGAW